MTQVKQEKDQKLKDLLNKDTFRCQIPSDVKVLDELHQKYKWIPGKDNIRPSPIIKQQKLKYLQNIQSFYGSEKDYIYETIFHFNSIFDENGLLIVRDDAIFKKDVFEANKFPYNLNQDTKHYIMWYSYYDDSMTEEKINNDISKGIKDIINNDNFDYIWYLNPKMTIPEIYHVQVFWKLKRSNNKLHKL